MISHFAKKVFLVLILLLLATSVVNSQSTDEKLNNLRSAIEGYEKEVTRLSKQAATLTNQIAQYDVQIKLTTLKIEEISEKISLLSKRLEGLGMSLNSLSNAHQSRAVETYKLRKSDFGVVLLISSDGLSDLVRRLFYLRKVADEDAKLMVRLKEAQTLYENQKTEQERLQEALKVQEVNLLTQKKAKANLLSVTKNDEKRYQQLLAQARAEFEAIQAIVAGKGEETEVKNVSEGERIASIIQGSSCNSSGNHVHFIVTKGSEVLNPFGQLTSNVSFENCSGSSCGSSDGDPFNPGGSWTWPINGKVKFMQGYGATWAIRNSWVGRIYSFHNGIDIDSSDTAVKAVKAGKLFRGSYGVASGCRLRYVRVDHADSDYETYYLHVNY